MPEGAVATIAVRFLVAAAVDNCAAISNALVGFLATLSTNFFLAFAAPSPKFSNNFPKS